MRGLLRRVGARCIRWCLRRASERTPPRRPAVTAAASVVRPAALAEDLALFTAPGGVRSHLGRTRPRRPRDWTAAAPVGIGMQLMNRTGVPGCVVPGDLGLPYAVLACDDGTKLFYAGTDDVSSVLAEG